MNTQKNRAIKFSSQKTSEKDTLDEYAQAKELQEIKRHELEQLRKALEVGIFSVDEIIDMDNTFGFAVSCDNFKLVKLLLEHNVNPNIITETRKQIPIFFAQTAEMIKLLAKHGADINVKNIIGSTPLAVFTCRKDEEIVKTLLLLGADPNIVDNEGNTPLTFAVCSKEPKIVKMLLESNTNPKIKNKDGISPLDCAKKLGHEEIVKLLEK